MNIRNGSDKEHINKLIDKTVREMNIRPVQPPVSLMLLPRNAVQAKQRIREYTEWLAQNIPVDIKCPLPAAPRQYSLPFLQPGPPEPIGHCRYSKKDWYSKLDRITRRGTARALYGLEQTDADIKLSQFHAGYLEYFAQAYPKTYQRLKNRVQQRYIK